jgi:hypothetical protein
MWTDWVVKVRTSPALPLPLLAGFGAVSLTRRSRMSELG